MEPEETGAAKMSLGRRLWRWTKRIVIGLVILLVFLAIIGALYEAWSRRSAARNYPPPGRLINIGGRNIHLDCRGRGSPLVVFEAGSDTYGSLSWAKVQGAIAGDTRTCAYDRAGIMWSDRVARQDGESVADDLHKALAAAGEQGPMILAAHSLGAVYAMIYTRKYPDQVAGLVLVDPGHPDQEKQLAAFPAMQEMTQAFETVQGVSSSLAWIGLPRLLNAAIVQPNVPSSVIDRSNAFYVHSLDGMLAGMKGLGRTMAKADGARNFGDRPVVVLGRDAFLDAATLAALGLSKADGDRFNADWRRFRMEEASWSTRGRNRIVPDTGHYIQFDRPAAVIAAIRDVTNAVRGGAPGKVDDSRP